MAKRKKKHPVENQETTLPVKEINVLTNTTRLQEIDRLRVSDAYKTARILQLEAQQAQASWKSAAEDVQKLDREIVERYGLGKEETYDFNNGEIVRVKPEVTPRAKRQAKPIQGVVAALPEPKVEPETSPLNGTAAEPVGPPVEATP